MRSQEFFFNYMNRKLFYLLILFIIVSCSDKIEYYACSDCISFNPNIQHSWSSISRSSMDIPSGTVTFLGVGGENKIYLHTFYTDSIASDFFIEQSDSIYTSRAIPIKGENMYNSFGVSAYSYTGSWDGSQTPNFMYDVPIIKSRNWSPSSDYYWPGISYKIRFFAYAPNKNMAYQLSGQTAGNPTITCTIPDDVAEQKDLLVASSKELNGNHNSDVDLTFHHALTAVKFICGDKMLAGTVKRITLKNVYSKGTYNMETGEWDGYDSPTSFSQSINKKTEGMENDEITSESQTFMMIPQHLPDNAGIEIVFDDGTQEHILKADLKNHE